MPAGNLTDEDLNHIETLLGTSAQDNAIRTKIDEDLPPKPPPPPAPLQLERSADGKTVKIVTAPGLVDFALTSTKDGGNVRYDSPVQKLKGLKPGESVHGEVGYEWADARVEGQSVWWSKDHGRVQLTVESSTPVEPPPAEPPSPTSLKVGMVAGGWGGADITDAKAGGQTGVRLENPSSIDAYLKANLSVLWLANIYNTGGFKAVSRSSLMERVRKAAAAGAWVIEVGNEPGGDWFFGGSALSESNAKAYGEAILEALAAAPNSQILASWDGGHAGGEEWGKLVLKTTPSLKGHSRLLWSVHCYAGSSANPSATKLNPPSGLCQHLTAIDKCHAATECGVVISELGFPTKEKTGDSPLCTEAQQKLGHELSLGYCRERPYVKGYFCYGYRDGSGAKGYGVVRSDDSKKPAFAVLHP